MNIRVQELQEFESDFTSVGRERNATRGTVAGPRAVAPNIVKRRLSAPQRFNGIHRRRRKKIMW